MSAETLPLDVEKIREDFPILARQVNGKDLVYLDSAASSQRPRSVIQSMVDVFEQDYANVHRGVHWLSERSTDLFEQAREKVRVFLNAAGREEIIFTHGTTESINLVARSWGDANVQAGDEILVTEMEHHANLVPWHQLAERVGCSIPIDDRGDLDLEAAAERITAKTKLVAVTAISNVLGTVNPIERIVEMAHAHEALVLVDAAQAVAHQTLDVQAWNADFVAFGGHKMLGPTGIGVLYGKQRWLEAMPPFLGGGAMIRRVYLDRFEPAGLPEKFEAGTPPIAEAIGLGAAVDYLNSIGLEAIDAHVTTLGNRTADMLRQMDAVSVLGDPTTRAGIVSFEVQGVHAHDVAQILDRHGVAIRAGHHCTMPLHHRLGVPASCRASFACYSRPESMERLQAGLVDSLAKFQRRRK